MVYNLNTTGRSQATAAATPALLSGRNSGGALRTIDGKTLLFTTFGPITKKL
jgi:hypothetical protein